MTTLTLPRGVRPLVLPRERTLGMMHHQARTRRAWRMVVYAQTDGSVWVSGVTRYETVGWERLAG